MSRAPVPHVSERLVARRWYITRFSYIFIFLLLALLGAELYGYVDMKQLHHDNAREEAFRDARYLKVTVRKLIAIAEEGGGVIANFIASLNAEGETRIRLIHSSWMDNQFGAELNEQIVDSREKAVFEDGKPRNWETKENFVFLFPYLVEKRCQQCHFVDSQKIEPVPLGAVIATVEVKIPKTALHSANQHLDKSALRDTTLALALALLFSYGFYHYSTTSWLAERRIHAIIQSVGEGIMVLDDTCHIIFLNQELADIFGYDPEELMEQPLELIMPEGKWGKSPPLMHRQGTATPLIGKRIEITGVRKDGTDFPIEIRIEQTGDASGPERQFSVAVRNITDRKKAARAIIEKTLFIGNILESPTGIAFTATDLDFNITYFSRAAEFLYGHIAAQVIGKPLLRFSVLDENTPARLDAVTRVVRRDGVFHYHTESRSERGPRHVETQITGIQNLEGELHGFLFMARDITEKIADEERLRTAKEVAEKATKLKDKFISLVAHDLKAPFGSILGLLELMINQPDHGLNTRQQDMLHHIIKSGKQLSTLIDEVLDISRLQTGSITLQPTFFDAYVVALSAMERHRYTALRKGITIENTISPGARIHGDAPLITEVIQNLIGNAVKFCEREDRITLSFDHRDNATSGSVTFTVEDTGVGVDSALLPNLFTPMVKTSALGTDGEVGTGLGLPYCHDIMLAHGGSLDVLAPPGEGATFIARLPKVRPVALVADSDPASRDRIRKILRGIDVDQRDANNGREALQLIKSTQIDLVISEVSMPLMDGLLLLDRIKKSAQTKTLPVILVTTETSILASSKAQQSGADDFIGKDLLNEELAPRVRKFVA